jgi:aminotransferase
MHLSNRSRTNPPSGIRTMFALAANYPDAANLGVGEPNYATPEHIVERGVQALREGATKYTPNAGIAELRKALAAKLAAENAIPGTERNILVATGACETLMLCISSLLDPGDELLIPDPCWPNYLGQVHLAGGVAVPVRTYAEDAFHMRAKSIEEAITPRTKALLLNSPSNPTGAVLRREELSDIAEVIRRHDLAVISDEPYEHLLYDGRVHVSLASLPGMADRVLTVNSFSKTYAMTGWRVGFVHGPEEIIASMARLQENFSSCVNAAAQVACLAALDGPQDAVEKMRLGYQRRRDLLVEGLRSIPGVRCHMPEGAFYAFPDISAFGKSSEEMARLLLEKAGVVTVPGNAFGAAGEGFLRLSFAASETTIETALERMRAFLTSLA